MAKKRFIFDENYIKRYAKKDKTKWLIIGVSALVLIIVIIIVVLATKNHHQRKVETVVPKFQLKEELVLESGSELPEAVDYFSELENIDIEDIKVSYPEEFEISYDLSRCSDEEIEAINEEDANILDYACATPMLKTPNTYGITVNVQKKDYTVNLKVVDTTAPVVLTKTVEIFVGEEYKLEDFINQCYDVNDICTASFVTDDIDENGNPIDYSAFKDEGTYNVKLKAVDGYQNESDVFSAELKIVKPDKILYTVTFNSNGGSEVKSVRVPEGEVASEPEAPTREGYTFDGWYRGNNKFDFSTGVTTNITLTAHWQKNENTGNGSGGGQGGSGHGSNTGGVSIGLNYKKVYIYVGESKTVTATVQPSNTPVTWSSSDNSIATVNNGVITGVKAGTVTVTASAGGKSASVEVVIKDKVTSTCQFGDASYNTNLYTLSVNLTVNGCAINPNSNPNESLSISDYTNVNSTFAAMGIKPSGSIVHKITRVKVKNNSGLGLVGYQIVINLEVIDKDNPYMVMKAEYVLKPDGTRIMRSNNIAKNGIKFQ